jgi:hypothetical protein
MPVAKLPPGQISFRAATALTGLSYPQLLRCVALGKLKTHAEPGRLMTVGREAAERLAAERGMGPAAVGEPHAAKGPKSKSKR